MTLVKKFSSIFLLIFLLFFVILMFISWHIILRSYLELEDKEIINGMNRILSSIEQKQNFLEDVVIDWAVWTDTYDFINDKGQRYIDANLGIDTYQNLNINMLLIYDIQRNLLFAGSYDNLKNDFTDYHQDFKGYDILDIYMEKESEDVFTDIININNELFIFSLHPVYKSYLEQEANGFFIMAFHFDENRKETLSRNVLADIDIIKYSEDIISQTGDILEGKFYIEKDSKGISSYYIIKDIFDDPSFIIKADFHRDIYMQGRSTVFYYLFFALILGIFFFLFSLILLKNFILKRLNYFSRESNSIGNDVNLENRIRVRGNDELSRLALSVNKMLDMILQKKKDIDEDRQKYINFVEMSKDAIIVLHKREIKYTNRAFARMTGYLQEEVIGTKLTNYIAIEEMEHILYDNDSGLIKDDFSSFETMLKSKNGDLIDIDISIGSFKYKGDMANFAVIKDITISKRANQTLQKTKEILEITLSSLGFGIITTDIRANIILMNSVASELIGCDRQEILGKPVNSVLVIINKKTRKPYTDIAQYVIKNKDIFRYDSNATLVDMDANLYIIDGICTPLYDTTGHIRGAVIAFRDITEDKYVQEEFVKMQKLDSISTLAGGIAHDFNNYLMNILGKLSLAILNNNNDKVNDLLYSAEKIVYQARDLVGKLIIFSKGGTPRMSPNNLKTLIEHAVSIALIGSSIDPDISIQDDLSAVLCDEGQITQALTNILINSKEAMPKGGTVFIKAKNVREPDHKNIDLKGDSFIKIEIMDQGIGISEEQILKVFDPYYTDKTTNLGLGLSISYSIIKKHGGYLLIESERGSYTRVIIYLPAMEELSEHIVKEAKPENRGIIKGSGKILIMDDDPNIREILGEILVELGYSPGFAKEGKEAILEYKEHKENGSPYDMVIMDLTIKGGMGGKEAIKELLAYDKNAKAIISSGYSNDSVMSKFKEYGFIDVLIKPYNIKDISIIISKVLSK